jgi:hypothetical protein
LITLDLHIDSITIIGRESWLGVPTAISMTRPKRRSGWRQRVHRPIRRERRFWDIEKRQRIMDFLKRSQFKAEDVE